jgi:aromatic-amino-acid transaminase
MNLLPSHVAQKSAQDTIFEVAARARAARSTGDPRVIDASVGQMIADDGRLWMLRAVEDWSADVRVAETSPYAPFLGTNGFGDAVRTMVPAPPGLHQVVVASPGAAGAVYLVVSNYTRPGDDVLVHTPCWPAYTSIVTEHGRNVVTWPLLDGDRLHVDVLAARLEGSLRARGRALVILNTPAHNPTGFTLDDRDWAALVGLLHHAASRGDPIVLLLDVSYLEFAADPERERRMLHHLADLPANVLVTVAWSASKAYAVYGWRTGALVAASRDTSTLADLERVCAATVRGTWGNPPRPGMLLVERIHAMASVAEDRAAMRAALAERAGGLCPRVDGLPYRDGFFAVLRHADPVGAARALELRGVFVVPLDEGVRVSLAGVPGPQIPRLTEELLRVCSPA